MVMRKVIGCLLVAAAAGCAASGAATGSGSGSGTGSGSGSGTGSGSGSGTGSGSNGAGWFTLDSSGFIVQGNRWWTDRSGPMLAGSIQSDGGALEASVGGQVVAQATIDGHDWSLQLPDGTIAAADTTVALKLSAPGKDTVEQDQVFDLDAGMPVIAIAGTVHDERGDTIDFSTGEPVHTHAGAVVDLSAGCPDVYKYAYLTAAAAPAYGKEAAPDPIALSFDGASPVGIDSSATAVRVRLDDGTVALDWALLVPDDSGHYPFVLHEDGAHPVPQLANRDGGMLVDVRFRDAFGHENVATACFKYHPLAAPLEIEPIAKESSGEVLWGMTLPADSPIPDVLGNHPVAVVGQRFVQTTAEPIVLQMTPAISGATYSKDIAERYVATDNGQSQIQCGTATSPSTDARCQVTSTAGADTMSSGSLAHGAWSALVIDELTGQIASACDSTLRCTIPARAPGAAPHAYRLVTYATYLSDLWPLSSAPQNVSLLGRVYTGYAPTTTYSCTTKSVWFDQYNVRHFQCQYTTYAHFFALDHAVVDFIGFGSHFETSVGGSVPLAPVPYQPGESAAMSWDTQVDVLPGQ